MENISFSQSEYNMHWAWTNTEMSRIKALGFIVHHVQMDMFSHIIGWRRYGGEEGGIEG